MGKQIIWVCDVCGQQVQDNPQSNFTVALNSSGRNSGVLGTYDAIVCVDCAASKSMQQILAAISDVAKKATNLIVVAAVTLKAVNVDSTIQGIPVNAAPIISKPISIQPAPAQLT